MPQPIALQPLHCAECGALVPLGHGSTAPCPYCRAITTVPREYGDLQRAAQSFADDRKLARELYGRVGRPPGWLLRTWGRGAQSTVRVGGGVGRIVLLAMLANPLIGLALVMAAAYLLGYPVAAIVHAVEGVQGAVRLPISPLDVLPIAALPAVLLVGVPAVLVGRERALAHIRRDIHASLAAALPERPGGPSRCRCCGAPLDVPGGALGVPCTYCFADNLVALPRDWVERIQGSEFQQFLRIDAALVAYREATRVARERLWKLGFGLLLVFPLVMALGWLLIQFDIHY